MRYPPRFLRFGVAWRKTRSARRPGSSAERPPAPESPRAWSRPACRAPGRKGSPAPFGWTAQGASPVLTDRTGVCLGGRIVNQRTHGPACQMQPNEVILLVAADVFGDDGRATVGRPDAA